MVHIMKCGDCGRYTLSDVCPKCSSGAFRPLPPKYSPQDRYGAYRRISIIEEYGENGKHSGV
ncbi:MAG: RNA-protein complex protein Nop10 [Candidatus Methanoplasma sp.]|jgi:H/ACA ribonucleoprotein complex subunit 3|nr:RNA-protein complex protein Nop10 [Candidatus Methanoplasma sp.]